MELLQKLIEQNAGGYIYPQFLAPDVLNWANERKNQSLVLFGASLRGARISQELLKRGIKVAYFCDNDPIKCGEVLNGIKVLSLTQLAGIKPAPIVGVIPNAYQEIATALNGIGISEVISLGQDLSHVQQYEEYKKYNMSDNIILPRDLCDKVRGYTMLSLERLDNAYRVVKDIEERKIPGDIVECGVWRGGCAGVMAAASKNYSAAARNIYLFDSFQGLPEPTGKDGWQAGRIAGGNVDGKLVPINDCVSSIDAVTELFFNILEYDKNKVFIYEGWFQDTVPHMQEQLDSIAVLRLDCDWYESTMFCLEYFFPKVVPGGYIIFDDYGAWQGCRQAVDDYFKRHNIKDIRFHMVDDTGVYITKG